MAKRILDTSVLVRHWRLHWRKASGKVAPDDVQGWADELAALHDSHAIVTPVYVEFICGTRNKTELLLAVSYLGRLDTIDHGEVLNEDWREAERIARRVPRDGKPRQLGDCLVRAVANRLSYDVFSLDAAFPA